MAVRAYRTILQDGGPDSFTVEHTFECGQYDSMIANGNADWQEIWRDCDMGTKNRRTLWPYASGLKGVADVDIVIPGRQRHRKYFPASDDSFASELDMSDINGGFLPLNYCTYMDLLQNGKKLPCEGFGINYTLSKIVIEGEWTVPGASYEVIFWAAPYGGSSSPGT